jgi:hypothetical protein
MQQDYTDAIDEANRQVLAEAVSFLRMVIPENTGVLLNDYIDNAMQGRIASFLFYADRVEESMGPFRKASAVPQAAQKTREFVDEISPRIAEFVLKQRRLIRP